MITIPATGHSYDFVNGILKCIACGELFNGEWTDGKYYYLNDGVKVKAGAVKVGEDIYYFGMNYYALAEGAYSLPERTRLRL